MYYYAVVLAPEKHGATSTTSYVGYQPTRADVIKYFRDEMHACVLNLIELTEEEYEELRIKDKS